MSDRVVLVVAELNLTTAMLELPAAPSFAEVRQRPLEFFSHAREDVRGCVSTSPSPCPSPCPSQLRWGLLLTPPLSLQVDPSHQPSGRLRHWLHKLQVAMRTVSHASGAMGFEVTGFGVPALTSELTQPICVPAAGEPREHGVPESHHHRARPAGAGQPALRCPAGQVLSVRPTAPPRQPGKTTAPRCYFLFPIFYLFNPFPHLRELRTPFFIFFPRGLLNYWLQIRQSDALPGKNMNMRAFIFLLLKMFLRKSIFLLASY